VADPKNKWARPEAPPAPMFFGEKERNLVKQVNDELAERVLGQTIAYYPISIEESNFNDTYGESLEKVSLPPVRVFAYVVVENEQTNSNYGYEYQTKLTVNFHRRRLVEDQDLYVRVGDFIQYGDLYYEIVKLYNDTRYLFGQVEHKFQISAECVRARQGVFRVMPEADRPAATRQDPTDSSSPVPAGRSAPYPPLTATYITVNPEAKLPNERVLTAGAGVTLTDSGAGGTITIDASSAGASAIGPVGAVQLQQGAGVFTGSAGLTFLSSSGRLGINTDSPSYSLTVIGAMSASSIAYFGDDTYMAGTIYGAGSMESQIVSASAFVSASLYYGDGRYLTNVTASAVQVADGPVGSLQFRVDDPIAYEISGTSKILYDIANSSLKIDTGLAHNRTAISSVYTASAGNYILGVTSVPTEISFDATSFVTGTVFVIKDESGNASATNLITINPSASQTIDGSGTAYIESPYGSVFLYTDGTDWFIY